MAIPGAMLRLAIISALASELTACVTRLDRLRGVVEDAASPSPEPQQSTTFAEASPIVREGGALPAREEGGVETTTPAPTTSPCSDGLLGSDGFCIPRVRCAPGTFVDEAGGARVCSPCASGHYSSDYDAEECERWRDCIAGDYVKEPGTATSNRECETCPSDESTATANSGECTGASDCEAGSYKLDGGCERCSAGSYCSGKTAAELPCASDTWDDDGDPGTPCVVKTTCAQGQFVDEDGGATVDRTCLFCDAETFAPESNAESCSPWTVCKPGTYVNLQGTSTSDRECSSCSTGTFSSSSNVATCETWKLCAAPSEYEATLPSSEEDRECSACPAGYQAGQDNATACEVPIPPNLVVNYDFESDSNGWHSWVGNVSTSATRAYSGARSLLVSGSSTGPAATFLDNLIAAGATYDVTFWVTVGRVSTAQVNVTVELNCNGSSTYLWVANNPSVSADTWSQLSGSFSVPSNCGGPRGRVYAEGSGANVDLYVDNVSVTRAP